MKRKSIWKALGAAAAVAGLAPYKITKDAESGKIKATALLWNATYAPAAGEAEQNLTLHLGLNLPRREDTEDEAHLFTDDVTVNYTPKAEEAPEMEPAAGAPAEEAAPTGTETVEEPASEAPADPAGE